MSFSSSPSSLPSLPEFFEDPTYDPYTHYNLPSYAQVPQAIPHMSKSPSSSLSDCDSVASSSSRVLSRGAKSSQLHRERQKNYIKNAPKENQHRKEINLVFEAINQEATHFCAVIEDMYRSNETRMRTQHYQNQNYNMELQNGYCGAEDDFQTPHTSQESLAMVPEGTQYPFSPNGSSFEEKCRRLFSSQFYFAPHPILKPETEGKRSGRPPKIYADPRKRDLHKKNSESQMRRQEKIREKIAELTMEIQKQKSLTECWRVTIHENLIRFDVRKECMNDKRNLGALSYEECLHLDFMNECIEFIKGSLCRLNEYVNHPVPFPTSRDD